ncbi:MAG: N-acetylneuraminate synthase [Dechloromonas sp.]|nr:N-acetylneuraminate synthase [Dechloromonas sp.]
MSVIVIAEAGVNHNGDIDLARRLVDVAAAAGADYVKFQTFKAERLVTRDAPKANYQKQGTNTADSQFEMLQRLELPDEMHVDLIEHCSKKGISFLSTGFDIESLDFLASMQVPLFKVPSGEITNLPYLRHIGGMGKPIVLSTGMATLSEIGDALTALEQAGVQRDDITVLHCTTEYPTPMIEVNLLAMATIHNFFGVKVGYSDHTKGIEIPIAAVAMGAVLIEKHFTLDRTLPGPDHKASLEPAELAAMVAAIRNVERALGDGVKQPSASEARNIGIVRKSLVAGRAIRAGEPYTLDNLTVKRPGIGISPMRLDEMLDRTANRDYGPDELIDP